MKRNGIILAFGSVARLYPVTQAVSKHLMPVYEKPIVFYPLTTLMLSGIRDVLLISTPQDTPRFVELLGDGSQWGINIQYAIQQSPDGLAQAFVIGRDFVVNKLSALVLGDNIFYGHGLVKQLGSANSLNSVASVFAHHVHDPERYGGADHRRKSRDAQEHLCGQGIVFLRSTGFDIAADIKPSARGEVEITDVTRRYLEMGQLCVEIMGRGYAWLDTGTHDSLLEASGFIATLQKHQGLMVACPEEIAFHQGWINVEQLEKLAQPLAKNGYGQYLLSLLK
jgi:glucose-1-phosphate thymidylyltransferase